MSKSSILFKEIGIKKLLEVRSWHQSVLPYVRGFYVSRCLQSLEMCGFLDVIRNIGYANIADFLKPEERKNFSETSLRHVCDYLFSIGIFLKYEDNYRLTKLGKQICLNRHGYFNFVHAYGPIFYELPDIIMGKKVYGKDIFRKDKYVAKATAEISEWLPLPAIRHLIGKYEFKSILDLGCGYGELLISLAKKTKLTNLCGIDIAEESIQYGKEKIQRSGFGDKIKLRVGDINKPELLSDWYKTADVITIMFVLHEFLDRGESYLIEFLKTIKVASSPTTAIFIAETPKRTEEDIRKHPSSVAEHHLFHKLSNQGILEKEQLRRIVTKAGLNIIEDMYFSTFSQHYILAR